MKNKHASILVLITCIFSAFTLGFLTGRVSGTSDVKISTIPQAVETLPVIASDVSRSGPPQTAAPTEPSQDAGLVNINTANLSQLDSLPGIGPVLGQRIIDYRTEHGPFTDVSQLLLVEGIGEKRLANILDLITVK